jgi:hypothetical protein
LPFQLHSGPKLADLYADLKIQDKVELELKKLKAEDMDKDGMKEAEVRRRLLGKIDSQTLYTMLYYMDK